jgi:hypothetical protein
MIDESLHLSIKNGIKQKIPVVNKRHVDQPIVTGPIVFFTLLSVFLLHFLHLIYVYFFIILIEECGVIIRFVIF